MDQYQSQEPQPNPPPASEPPPSQQGWSQPAPQSGWPPQQQAAGGGGQGGGYYASPARPGAVTLTGVFYIVLGIIVSLIGGFALAVGQVVSDLLQRLDLPGLGDAAATFVTIVAIALLFIGLLWIISGIGIFLAKQWARVSGVAMGIVGVIVFGLFTLAAVSDLQEVGVVALVIYALLFALSAVGIWALIQAGPYFAYRR